MPTGPTVLSCQPASGVFGTKVFLKVSSQYDLFSMSAPMPYFFLLFGSEKCPMQDVTREAAQDSSGGFVYSCSADAPQLLVTGSNSSNVPLSLVIEGPAGEDISRTVAGSFQYLEGSEGEVTRTAKVAKHDTAPPGHPDQPSTSPKTDEHQHSLGPDGTAATNNYDYPGQQGQYANTFPQNNGDMITTTYRSASFTDPHYHHRRSTPGWSNFGSATLGSTGRSSVLDHHSMAGRPSLTPLPMPSSTGGSGGATPQLIRTSTISNGSAGGSGAFPPMSMSMYSTKAVLKINGKLDSMADNWTQEEWDNRRRIVMFRRTQTGSTLNTNFRAVPVNERPPNSVCISCIWWAEKGECYVTSVDTIYLLEQLVAAPNRFTVEEKNRIRRNLEGFHPLTVSKAKADSEDFFKLIMGFPNPKPRNIEKDVKVFPWKSLEASLKKIISKYSANPSSTLPPANMVPAVSSGTPYATLPTPPGHHGGMSSQQSLPSAHDHHSQSHSQYPMPSHHDSIPSPRSVSGSQHGSWAPYSTAAPYTTAAPAYSAATTRTLSPSVRIPSPQHPAPMRINTNPLPAVTTYDTRTVTTGGYGTTGGLHTPISHHPSASTPPRWESSAPSSYADGYPSLTSQHHHAPSAQPVYSAAYGDPAARA